MALLSISVKALLADFHESQKLRNRQICGARKPARPAHKNPLTVLSPLSQVI
jgi:hypothetical protein